ncbi:uncharacterized protein MYCFIDRAFT_169957 [Pseudocercospora fijiensis CIRAD86]|uniref:Uncharacterized protein n=1 Tax=Pseudocercospora fijiensis (strain CIRAD86) TaxID=383855 RepID=N1QB31_PSEFD|nr:uncharacterized protein MYCFIDRAFT_169957 [Pseudocercospora fijiensis CIRAD86]EME88327.1 hypothetical protein MYCFIDRAFT_169957 [Pseudocercospora fijiensis CIRAD86]
MIQLAIKYKFGHHIIDIFTIYGLETLEQTMKCGVWSLLFGFLSPMLGRISFCCTLLFLTKTDSRVKTWPIYCIILFQLIVNVVGVVVFFAQCGTNLDTFWTFEKQLKYDEYCWHPTFVFLSLT